MRRRCIRWRLHNEVARCRAAGRPFKSLSIGCGPINEIVRFIHEDELSEGCEFHLMDFNEPTLEYAQNRYRKAISDTGRRCEVKWIHKSIHELLAEAKGKKDSFDPVYDYVYCAGLFDYLSKRICSRLIELYYSWINPGGLVNVTNVAHSDPIVVSLELLMEWYLIYRSSDDMLAMTPGLGTQHVSVDDETGINLFLEVRKDEDCHDER